MILLNAFCCRYTLRVKIHKPAFRYAHRFGPAQPGFAGLHGGHAKHLLAIPFIRVRTFSFYLVYFAYRFAPLRACSYTPVVISKIQIQIVTLDAVVHIILVHCYFATYVAVCWNTHVQCAI